MSLQCRFYSFQLCTAKAKPNGIYKGSFTNYVSSWGGGLGADDTNVFSMGLTSPSLLTGRESKSPIFT